MTVQVVRASIERLLEFCNEVREAGGGTPLDALMPATPEDPSQCLIAQGVNFESEVNSGFIYNVDGEQVKGWFMSTGDEDIAMKIGEKLGLTVGYNYDPSGHSDGFNAGERYVVALPLEIGQVAADFDDWAAAIDYVIGEQDPETGEWGPDTYVINQYATPEEVQKLKDFWPYVEESMREAYENASFVNENGELII